jgi:hypothetical protein
MLITASTAGLAACSRERQKAGGAALSWAERQEKDENFEQDNKLLTNIGDDLEEAHNSTLD